MQEKYITRKLQPYSYNAHIIARIQIWFREINYNFEANKPLMVGITGIEAGIEPAPPKVLTVAKLLFSQNNI